MKTTRSQLIQKMKNNATLLRSYAYTLPVSPEEREDVYDAAQALEEGAHRVALDDRSERTNEIILFAYFIFGVAGFAIGVIATLWFT